MNERTEALVRVSARMAARDEDSLRDGLERASAAASPPEVEEVLMQGYLFLGYPIALNAFALWRGLGHESDPGWQAEDPAEWSDRGTEVCGAVYRGQYEGLRKNIRRLHPDMETWMVDEGYGKVLGRPGLDLPTRELCIVSQLVVLDVPKQLYSHMRGALNVGATVDDVARAVGIGGECASESARDRAAETWRAVRARREA